MRCKASILPGVSRWLFSTSVRGVVAVWLMGLLVSTGSAAVLTHRYPFDNDANDVIGGADGTLQGNAFLADGAVVVDGTNGGVQLPNNLILNNTSMSFEVWFVDQVASNADAVLYQFDGANGRIVCTGAGRGSYTWLQVTQRLWMPEPIPGITNHLVWTQDADSHTACFYLNGVLAAKNTGFTLTPRLAGPITNSWVGAAGPGAAVFKGSIQEFRVYQGSLSSLEVAQLDAAGPDSPQVAAGSLQDIRIAISPAAGPGALLSPGVFADYANLTNVNLLSQPGLTFSSDNTNVIAVATVPNLLFPFRFSSPHDPLGWYTNIALLTSSTRLRTTALGVAGITASYEGFSNSTTVTVDVPQGYALIHRYRFDEPADAALVHDSVGHANGRVIGYPSAAGFTGNGELLLGTSGPGYVRLPPGLISGHSEITVEAWLTYEGVVLPGHWTSWSRFFDFGDQFGGVGKTYFFLTPMNDSMAPRAAISGNGIPGENPILNGYPLRQNATSHVAVAYSPVRGVASFYINGRPVNSRPAATLLSAINDMNNWLGRSQFVEDPYLKARYNEFRVYRGLLRDSDVAADYSAGADVVGTDFILCPVVSGTNLLMTWGASAADWILESSSTVGAGAIWDQVAATPVFEGGRLGVTVPMSDMAGFFRLRKP